MKGKEPRQRAGPVTPTRIEAAEVMNELDLSILTVPDAERDRQAVSSLRGYGYQLYQSLDAWLSLKRDEVLLLEVAEDFAVLAKGALTGTQVKDTAASGSVTLKSKSVRETLQSLWRFQEANPKRTVTINYLTTSQIGREKELTFPDRHTGLTYWRVAAREASDVSPMRQALLTLALPSEILDFVRTASDTQLRDKILRRIKWICGVEGLEDLDLTICDKLVYLGEESHCTSTDSEGAKDSLLAEILRKATQKHEDQRMLSRADLLRTFERSVSVSIPRSTLRQWLSVRVGKPGGESDAPISPTGLAIDLSPNDFPALFVPRQKMVTNLLSEIGRSGLLWLHGSSGVGKTLLSKLIANRSERRWVLVPLRNCSHASELDVHLRVAIVASCRRDTGGIILDDLPLTLVDNVKHRLAALMNELRRVDANLIVTATAPPSPSLYNWFGDANIHTLKVPNLNQEEVAELVAVSGGDPKKWAGVVHAFCGYGHPQLVCARVTGLRRRGWPDGELLDGMGGPAVDIDSERDAVRKRLISDISDEARELLNRLTMVAGFFDRELAVALGGCSPILVRPGEILDTLIGPWVETLGRNLFGVSPLVSDAGTKSLDRDTQLQIHRHIVDQLMTRRPFPAEFLGPLLSHAFVSRHDQGLWWISMAVLNAPDKDRRMLSEHLFLLPMLSNSGEAPLFPDRIAVSVMLRLAQFTVAASLDQTDRLEAIADRLMTEVRMNEDKTVSQGMLISAISRVLLEQRLSITPKKWMPWLAELENALSEGGEIAQLARDLSFQEGGLGDMTIAQFLFVTRATSLRSIDHLSELFSKLDGLTLERRRFWLSSLRDPYIGPQLLVQSAWVSDANEDRLDPMPASEQLHLLSGIAERWGSSEIAIECECTRAVLMGEYAGDTAAAHAVLDNAEQKYAGSVRLARSRATVYHRSGNHGAALEALTSVIPKLSPEDHVSRAFALRDAGISATQLGELARASSLFAQAHEAASQWLSGSLPMPIGLKGDRAIVEFNLGNSTEALKLVTQALTETDQLNTEAGLNEKFCKLVLGRVVFWIHSEVVGSLGPWRDALPTAGNCSCPNPPKAALGMKSPPFLLYWYLLAEVEAELNLKVGVLEELERRTVEKKMPSCEWSLNLQRMSKYVRSADFTGFASYLPEYITKIIGIRKAMNELGDRIETDIEFNSLTTEDWGNDAFLEPTKDAIVAIAASAVCLRVRNWQSLLLEHLERVQCVQTAVKPFLECFTRKQCLSNDILEIIATHIAHMDVGGNTLYPDELFRITCRFCNWLEQSNFKREVGNIVAPCLERKWGSVIENQKFRLNQPWRCKPAIQSALDNPLTGVAKIASLALAAVDAVDTNLDPEMRALLEACQKEGKINCAHNKRRPLNSYTSPVSDSSTE